MNILFLTSAAPEKAGFSTTEKRPPLGLGFLIAVLKQYGHTVYFSDEYLQPSNILETDFLARKRIDFVGIYSNTICYQSTLRMFQTLQHKRERHEWVGKIMVGGPHTSVGAHDIPEYVDYIVIGEGEESVPKIVNGEIKERILYGERIENLDALPIPAWEEFIHRPYHWHDFWHECDSPVYPMNTSRGCPFHCTFCSVKAIWGKTFRYMSAERVVHEIEYLIRYYGAKAIFFREDHFTLNKQRTIEFCELLLKKNIKIDWLCETRVDQLNDIAYQQLMKDAGCKFFYIGVESGSPRMLDFYQKGETREQFIDAFEIARRVGIKTYASFVVGYPTETEADRQLTEDLIAQINADSVGRNIFLGLPGSELYQHLKENHLYEYEDEQHILYPIGFRANVKKYYGDDSYFHLYDSSQENEQSRELELYNARYLQGYRQQLDGYELARWDALSHFISHLVSLSNISTVLDYGCGNGLHVKLWQQLFPDATLFFSDISTVALEQLIAAYPLYKNQSHQIVNNCTPHQEKSFDIIVSIEVMEHVEDLDAYLKEIFRLLKPGGYFIWTTPCGNRFSIEHVYNRLTHQIVPTPEGFRRWAWEDPAHIRRLKSDEIKQRLFVIGFKTIRFRYQAHFFSYLCTKLTEKRIMPTTLSNKLMKLDYRLFRKLSNGASMLGCAQK